MADPAPLPLTFGVEIEFTFAINEAQFEERHSYLMDVDEDSSQEGETDESAEDETVYRDTTGIIQDQAGQIIRHSNLDVQVERNPHSNHDYTVWQLTTDTTAGCHEDMLVDNFDKVTAENVADWPRTGLELVSRVLDAPELGERGRAHPSLREVGDYLRAIRPGPRDPWIVFAPPEYCGVHVHMGLDPTKAASPILPLKVLQHLVYILIEYEGIITLLHHPQRRGFLGTVTESMVMSNLVGLRGTGHICDEYTSRELEDIHGRVFGPDVTVKKLCDMMSLASEAPHQYSAGKWKIVNFQNIQVAADGNADVVGVPTTLEFRQHQGSLDAAEIGQWVCFVTALVRAAERQANLKTPPDSPVPSPSTSPRRPAPYYPGRQSRKYHFACANQEAKFDKLFDLLQLDRLARNYFMARFHDWNPNEFTELPRTAQCPVCEAEAYAEYDTDPEDGEPLFLEQDEPTPTPSPETRRRARRVMGHGNRRNRRAKRMLR